MDGIIPVVLVEGFIVPVEVFIVNPDTGTTENVPPGEPVIIAGAEVTDLRNPGAVYAIVAVGHVQLTD